MSTKNDYKGLDLTKCTIFDLAEVLTDCPAIFVSHDVELTDEEERIFNLYAYASEYELDDLKKKLKDLYESELISFS